MGDAGAQKLQQSPQLLLFARFQVTGQLRDCRGVLREDAIDQLAPFRREPSPHDPPILGGSLALHQSLLLQPVHYVGDVAARDEQLVGEIAEREWPEVVESLEHAELRRGEAILGDAHGDGAREGEVAAGEGDPQPERTLLVRRPSRGLARILYEDAQM